MTDDGMPDPVAADERGLSPSRAGLLLPPSCPAKFRWATDHPTPSTPVQEFGSVVHTLVFGAGDEVVILYPQTHGLTAKGVPADNPKSTAMWKAAEAQARARGAIPIHVDDHIRAQEIAAAVRAHPDVAPLIAEGHAEVPLEIIDPAMGVLLKGRLDWMTMLDGRVTIVELKTAACAEEHVWVRKADDYGYPLQAAWYDALVGMLGIDDDPDFVHVLVEKEQPYLCNVVRLDGDALDRGYRQMRAAISIYWHCQQLGVWPGYPVGVKTVSLPPWLAPPPAERDIDWSMEIVGEFTTTMKEG